MATYHVVDLYANMEEEAAPIHAELAHMRVDVDPGLMSLEEREQAAAALREALARVEPGSATTRPRRGKTSRRAPVSASAT